MGKDKKDRKKRKKEKYAGKSKKSRLEDTVNEGEVPGSSECSEPVHSDDRKEQQQDEEGYDSFPQMKINPPVQDGSIAGEISILYYRSQSVMDDICQNKEGSESDSFSKMKIMPAHSRNKAVEQKDDSSEDEISYEMDRPTLLRQLQVILSEYPDDAQILRELVQNAEDAGASCMKIMYDNTEKHPKGNYPLCQYFKTPGIAVFNDGMFTDGDWKGIIKIYDSIKQDEPLKVGRFGLGFKSVFHMTDSPVIISGTKLLVIDPIRSERKENEVREFTLKGVIKHQDPQSTLACIMNWFGFEMDILKEQFLYKGTLFWFPLRQVESSLSATIYIPKKVEQLLHSFTEEATYNLLFLKNLEKIEIYNKGKMCAPFYKLELNGVKDVNFVEERAQFKEKLVSVGKEMPAKSITSKYEVVIEANGEKEEFNVVNCLFGTEEIPGNMRGLLHDKELHYSPYTGVAYCTKSNKERKQPGHIFCFLPLPITDRSMTGLPFHVNGFFALEHNRRHLKEAASNCETKGSDKSILWNESMIVELLPKTFRILIQQLKLKSESAENSTQLVDDVYCCIPDPELVQPCWKPMLENLFNIILEGVFFFSRQGNGKWIKLYDALVAYFDNEDTEEVQATVKKFLLDSNSNLVELPNHVIKVLKYMKREPNKITPDIIADRIKKTDCWKSYTHDQKLHLLEFMLKTDNFSLLRSIELLPLKSGRFIEFETSSSEVLIAEDRVSNLFPGMDDRFVSRSVVTESIWGKLESIANGGFYQLKKMIPDDLPRLLYNVFDGNFKKKTKQIFIANNSDMFDSEWIKDVWKEIAAADFQDLVDFETLPVIPLIEHENKSVHEFLALKGLYIRPMDGYSVIGKVLQLMDVKQISEHDTIKFPHGDVFGKYILHPTNDNVMKILNDKLSSLMPDEIQVKAESINKQLNEENRIMLATYFEHDVMITSRETNRLLRNLKMFREHDNVSQPEMVSLEENCEVLDNFDLQFPEGLAYPRKLIQSEHLKLAKLLDASLVSETECITDTLALMMSKNAMYTQKDIVLIMKYLQDPGKLVILRKVLEKAKQLKFVNVLDNTYPAAAAADLFNPTIKALTTLFYGQDELFPSKTFLEENGLEIELLEKLGIKGKGNITSTDLVGVATSIDLLQLSGYRNTTKVQQKANALILFLKEQSIILTDTLLDEIKDLSWVQPFQVRPEGYPSPLKWWNDHHFCCPSDVKSLKFKSLLGSIVPLVDKELFPDGIVKHYRWEETPEPSLVIRHFKEVIESYKHEHNLQYLSSARDIMQFFHETRQRGCLSEDDLDSLKKMRCIPTGSYGFKNPNMVVKNIERKLVNFKLEPFLFEMASEIDPFKRTCLELGMLEAIDLDVLKMVLGRVESKYKEKNESSSTDEYNEVNTDMSLVTNVLKTIVDMRIEKSNLVDLLVPIASDRNDILKLEPVEKCTYTSGKSFLSVSNLRDEEDECDEDKIVYTHPEINDLAPKLGVASVTKRFMVDQKTAPMAWGQEEKLTTRISGLLDSYTDGLAVLKELIQNGDDAGATRVNILFDERTNSEWLDGLFDHEMAECQGQALWVYNDALFEEKDFENIIKLGGKTKIVDTEKIGKFGLGFCSVYNITDVPSFISGNSMVILDPHLFYLGDAAIGTNPGLRIPLTKGYKRNFQNQFSPFNNVFGCNLEPSNQKEYNSTLFRLPLRTQTQAGKSDIRKLPYTKREVVELFEKFLEGAGNVLLFTQNILEVCIYHLEQNSKNPDTEMKPVFKISKNHVMQSNNDYNVLKKVTSIMRNDIGYDLKLPLHCIDIRIKTFENAIELSSRFKHGLVVQSWMISWATGLRSFELAKTLRDQGAIPVGSVAVPILRKDDELTSFLSMNDLPEVGFYKNSHIFCFLPLPEKTSLPVHINGCFNVEQDRKRILYHSEDDKETMKSHWNDNMLEDVIPIAYLNLLVAVADRHTDSILEGEYWTLWPKITDTPSHTIDPLVQSFYETILTKPLPAVFYRKEKGADAQSCSVDQCVFLDPFFRSSNVLGQYAYECLLNFFEDDDGHVVMDMKKDVYNQFQKTCGERIKVIENCMITKQSFFEEFFFPNLKDSYWEQNDLFIRRNSLLKLALEDPSLHSCVQKYACIPVMSSRHFLQRPSDLVYEGGFVKALFDERDLRFPIDDFNDYSTTLLQLGMMDSEIPSTLLIERAQSVSKLIYTQAVIRSNAILQYLQIKCSIHKDVEDEIATISFLPAMKKPIDWPLSWGADSLNEEQLLSSSEMHRPSDRNKVGSVGYIFDIFNCRIEANDFGKAFDFLRFKPVSLNDAITQLEILGRENVKYTRNLMVICKDIYSELNSLLSRSTAGGDINERLLSLRDQNVICLKNALVKPNQVALTIEYECSPYLYEIRALAQYKFVWKEMQIAEKFDSEIFIGVLQEIGEVHKNMELKLEEVKIVVNILNNLCSTITGGDKISEEKRLGLVIPDNQCVLRPISEVCFDDRYPGILQGCRNAKIVYPGINQSIIQILGIKSKRQFHLSKFSSGIPFGQKEKLVTRLKGIVSGYPLDHSMLNELLQNADDAGASEVHFILDCRQHRTTHIFDNSWEPLQGPALCVFNDTCFSKKDLEGIQNLGEGSKSDDPTKTGKFGVGFNSVYHLTDAPSFLTKGPKTPNGGCFCVFDPHCKYAPAAEPEFPGMQIPDLEIFEESFKDVFNTYLQKELGYKEGTCFRLPLRNQTMADSSEIKSNCTTVEAVFEMFEKMEKNMKESLLFLASVKKIRLSSIDSNAGKLKNIANVHLFANPENESKRMKFNSSVKETCISLEKGDITLRDVNYFDVHYTVFIYEVEWLVVQGFGFPEPEDIPDSLVEEFSSKSIGLLPRSGVAFQWNEKFVGRPFCFLPLPIWSGLPVHVNGHFALDQNRSAIFGGTHDDDTRYIWNKYLIEQTLAHVYASSLLYFQNEKMQNYSDKNTLSKFFQLFPIFSEANGDWWQLLVFHVYRKIIAREIKVFPICPKYIHEDCGYNALNIDCTNPNRLNLKWVSMKAKEDSFDAVFDTLRSYYEIKQNSPEKWSYQPITLFGQSTSNLATSKKYNLKKEQNVRQTMIDLGMKLICTPINVCDSIHQACSKFIHTGDERSTENVSPPRGCICPERVNPKSTIKFLKSWRSSARDKCLINDLPIKLSSTVLKQVSRVLAILHFCLKEDDVNIRNLENIPLLLRNDGILQEFQIKNSNILSEFSVLFPTSGNRFVHEQEVCTLLQFRQHFRRLDVDIVRDLLESTLDGCQYKLQGPIDIPSKGIISEQWLMQFWKCLNTFDNIDALKDWCLLPCTWSDKKLKLVSLGFAHVICDTNSFRESKPYMMTAGRTLREILTKLCLPSLVPITQESKHIRDLVATYNYPNKVVTCLYLNRNRAQWSNLIHDECTELLKFLNDEVGGFEIHEKVKLKNLPLFTTITGRTVSLFGHKCLVVKCEKLPTFQGLNELSENANTLLIKHNAFHENIYAALNCETCYSRDQHPLLRLYTSFILPNFSLLPGDAQLCHLEFVRDVLLIYKDDVKTQLKTLRFIPADSPGDLRLANDYFSPHNPLFASFCLERELPPLPFCLEEWKEFMEVAGMQMVASEELYIRFASEMQQRGKTSDSEKQAKELIKNLFTVKNLQNKKSFLCEISKINFIPPYIVSDEYSSICEQFCVEQLISLRGSIPYRHYCVVWTMEKLLPEYASNYNETILKHLQVQLKPSITSLISHIHKICESLKNQLRKNECNTTKTSEILNIFYEYLENADVLDNELKVKLDGTPLIHILDRNTMVEAKCVVRSIKSDDEIAPYLLKAPDYYGRYFKLFIQLGATEEIAIENYCRVLETIKGKTRDKVVLPGDELKAVEKAIVGVLSCLQAFDEKSVEKLVKSKSVLYILNEKNVLKPSDRLVISDKFQIKRRLKSQKEIDFICDLLAIKIQRPFMNPEKLLMLLPLPCRPRLLSDIVTEELAINSPTPVPCPFADELEEFLTGDKFKYIAERLVKTYQRKCLEEVAEDEFTEICGKFHSLKVRTVNEIKTLLIYENLPLDGSTIDQSIFYCKNHHTLYLKIGVPFRSQTNSLAEILLDMFKGRVQKSNLLQILPNFKDDFREIKKLLDDINLEKTSFSLEDLSWYPRPGTPLEVDFVEYLVTDFSTFKKGDIAVFEHHDSSGEDSNDVLIYIFVRIIGRVSDDNDRFPEYLVNIGDGTEKRIRSFRLYKLMRTNGTSTEMESFTDGNTSYNEGQKDRILQEVEENMVDAMKLGFEEFKRVLRRMIRHWHPDKNQNSKFCEDVFKHIMEFAKKLQTKQIDVTKIDTYRPRGSRMWNDYVENATSWASHSRTYTQGNGERFDVNDFADGIKRGWGRRRRRQNFGQRNWFSYQEYVPDPQPHMARLWIRQAKHDVDTARKNLFEVKDTSCSWICFQSQQAVEKALKSVQVREDAKQVRNYHTLFQPIIYENGNEEIRQKVEELQGIVGNYSRMRYPLPLEYPEIPATLYSKECAKVSVDLAFEIVEMIDDKYFQ